MSVAVERKYALTKVATGDYLLPSNDALTIWRLQSYVDGPSHGLDDWPRDRTLWRVLRWTGDLDAIPAALARESEDCEAFSRGWQECDDGLATRREAIDRALSR